MCYIPSMKKDKLVLIDTNSIIHRAFHALPPLKSKSGEPSGAVYGSLLAFFKIINEFNPTHLAAVFDSPGETFRHEKYKEYKANRIKSPDELIVQIIKTQEVFKGLGVLVLAKIGLEADDILGVLSSRAPKNVETLIVTGDMDILQLVNEKTKVYTLKRGVSEGVLYDTEKVREKYGGCSPEQIIEIKGLQGDPSDNIPGVSGVGEKTAIKLIQEFGNLDKLYEALEKDGPSVSLKIKEKLLKERAEAFLSRELATIKKDDFQDIAIEDLKLNFNKEKAIEVLEELGFESLIKRFLEENKKQEEKNLKLNF